MRTAFEEELSNLHVRFSEMGMMVNESILKSVSAFVNHDKKLAQEVIEADKMINKRETDLEKTSFELIALQQPVTSDLRMIVTVLKASSDLERMGDHAVSIAKATIEVKGNERIPEAEELIAQMGDHAKQIVEDVLNAYVKEDSEKAEQIAKEDDVIDDFARRISDLCIIKMKENTETIVGGTSYMLVASYLERVGDYATNICEWIVYLKSGHVVELN
ncbi:phosphate signaling complex protein PhoU [Lactobacillus sp. YT155]|uniref:phosphate signaling complex protein PhoU n=1 Tax=Lactobacillus sp. YT155 TaxID=3060955 RepID=UPI0026600CCB|nr:phosphate signaling complex protein PhoU [Lactobacillus sp. YT155]MDO1605118.1 phosphate signaling complex protein PhoU [Lactobacillus sp. YT155]